MGEEKNYLEFDKVIPTTEQLQELEYAVNEHIRKNGAVTVAVEHLHEVERPDTLPKDIHSGVIRQIAMGEIEAKP